MAAAPASAAAALALLVSATGKIVAQGFDLGQIVGATGDASCLLFTRQVNGSSPTVMFVSAATSTAGAGVIALAQSFSAQGFAVLRYVISTTDLQALIGKGAGGAFASQVIAPTDVEWIDAVNFLSERMALS